MKKLLSIGILLLAMVAQAQIAQTNALIQFYQTNYLGTPDTNYFIIIKLQPPILSNGSVKTGGFATRCYPNTNGFFQTNLQAGFYMWTNGGIGAPGIVFTVPQTTNTYNAGIPYAQPGGCAISGYNTYVMAGVLGMSSSNATVKVIPIANSPGFFDLSSTGSGGSSFPLTADANFNGYAGTNINYLAVLHGFYGDGSMVTNIYGSNIVGTIIAQVQNWSDTAAHIDTNVWPLGVFTWAYDGDRATIGDGATFGGVPVGFSTWATPTNPINAGGRGGQMAWSAAGYTGLSNSPAALKPILWVDSGNGTNWIPLVAFLNPSNAPSLNEETGIGTTAFFALDLSTNGAFFDNFAFSVNAGTPGIVKNAIVLRAGGGGNAFENADDSAGGVGGNLTTIFDIAGGVGGNATASGGFGGSGGNVANCFVLHGGNGGNDAFGNIGGLGGSAGGFTSSGGSGGTATISASGGGGGAGGTINLSGGNASGPTAGGAGGFMSTTANGIFSGGTVSTIAQPARNGGNISTFASSYAPATLFTVSTSAGAVSTSSATSLIGTVQSLAGPSILTLAGANIPSNTVDHIGRTLRLTAWGYAVTNGTPTLRLQVTLGGTTVVDTGTQTMSSITTTQGWKFTAEIPFRTTGSGGTVLGQGKLEYGTSATAQAIMWATQTSTTSIDTTKDEAIDVKVTQSTGNGNVFICTGMTGEMVN